jgi:hypothetical protein
MMRPKHGRLYGRAYRFPGLRKTVRRVQRANKTVTATRHRLNKYGIVSRIAERVAKLFECRVNSLAEIYEGVGGPQLLPDFFAGHHFAGSLEKQGQNAERLILQVHPAATLVDFARGEVGLKKAED